MECQEVDRLLFYVACAMIENRDVEITPTYEMELIACLDRLLRDRHWDIDKIKAAVRHVQHCSSDLCLVVAQRCGLKERELRKQELEVLYLLIKGEEIRWRMSEVTHLNGETVHRALDRLVELGWVCFVEWSHKWILTQPPHRKEGSLLPDE